MIYKGYYVIPGQGGQSNFKISVEKKNILKIECVGTTQSCLVSIDELKKILATYYEPPTTDDILNEGK